MRTFTDNSGRVWTVSINVAAIKKVQGTIGINLYKIVDERLESLSEFLGDPIRLVDTLFCLCREEAEARGVSDEDFGRALAGDSIFQAEQALLEELVDFFPNPKVRENLRLVIKKAREIQSRLLEKAELAIASCNPEQEANKLLGLSGSAPVS